MATYYFRNAGVNWGDAANWSLTDGGGATGAVPLATDDVIFTNNSGNCTVNTSNRVCQTLNFNGGTGYTNTITFTFNISVGGSITLGASMVFAGAALLRYVGIANSTFTSNGKEVGVPFEIAAVTNNHTITYADNWTFGENFTIQSGTAVVLTFTGNTINCKKSLLTNNVASRGITGTTSIIMIGTGSIGTTPATNFVNVGLNLTINTVGSYTFNSLIWGQGGGKTFTYTLGTITVTANATLVLQIGATATNTLNLNGIDFENITIAGGATPTYTLTSNLKCKSLFTANGTPATFNGNTIFLTSFSQGNFNTIAGSTIFYFNCWSGNGTFNGYVYAMTTTIIDISNGNSLTLGNITLLCYGTNFTHLQGSLFPIQVMFSGTTIDIQPNVVFETISGGSGVNFTLLSNITVRTLGISTQFTNTNNNINGVGYSVTVLNSFIFPASAFTGTAKIIIGGNTSINLSTVSFAAGISIEFEINSPGVVTFNTSSLYPQGIFRGIFRHVKGQVIAKGTTLWFQPGSTILGASRCNFDNVSLGGSVAANYTIQMDEFFSGTPQLPTKVVANNVTINFQDGFEKIAKNVIVSGCTISRRGQLLLLSKGSFKATNVGIRYYNQSPNGVGSNLSTFVNDNLVGTQGFRKIPMLVGDPAYT